MFEDEDSRESFITALLREDELGAVVRAQIYLEHELREFIRSRLPAPNHLTNADLSFARLVRFALALGLPTQFGKPLGAFARIRNSFAHRLDTELTAARVNEYCQSFDEVMRREADERMQYMHILGVGALTKDKLKPRGLFNMYSWYLWYMLQDATKKTQEPVEDDAEGHDAAGEGEG